MEPPLEVEFFPGLTSAAPASPETATGHLRNCSVAGGLHAAVIMGTRPSGAHGCAAHAVVTPEYDFSMGNNTPPRQRQDRRRQSSTVHRILVAKTSHKTGHVLITGVLILAGLACIAGAYFSLLHPLFYGTYGAGQTSQLPDMLGGVTLLVLPAGLLGIAGYRVWWAARLDLAAREQRRRHVSRSSN